MAAALVLASTAVVAQQPAEPQPPELTADERARELYLRGDRLYAEGSYDESVLAFERAYELSRRPALLYDMANALERLGRYEEALRRLSQYVPHAPEHQREAVLKRIRSLEARAEQARARERAAAQAAAAPAEDLSPRAPAPSVSPRAAAPPPAAHPPAVPPPAAPPPAPPPPAAPAAPERSAPVLGYVLGGAGLASVGAGVLFGLSAASARSDAEARCSDDGSRVLCPSAVGDLLSDADRRALVADVAFGVGLVALGVGAYLVLSHDDTSGQTTELRTTAAAGGGRVSLVTTF